MRRRWQLGPSSDRDPQDTEAATLQHVPGHEAAVAGLILRAFHNYQADRLKTEAVGRFRW